ncbi:MAG: histidinol dehydrogenase [Candidatus Nitrosocaldaceae archaeon]|nr:MAG: histidinol dehydrogenase [Candidatus Nitrosocaldaceae archaeon]
MNIRIIDDISSIRKNIIKEDHIMIVKEIIDNVRRYGDQALKDYAKRFDNIELDELRISKEEIDDAYNHVSKKEIKALEEMIRRVKRVEEETLDALNSINLCIDGINIKRYFTPIENIGCYIPGGKAKYPSSVVMCSIPARVANVKRIIVTTPNPDPLTLVATDLCKIDEIYNIGGAQAIAAMAYGTESIERVDKIVGPGGIFVTIAKYLVSNRVSIDMLAGPTELLIIADRTANPKFIAYDLAAQAEHSNDTLCGLITNDELLIKHTIKELDELLTSTERSAIIRNSLESNGFIIRCNDMDEAINIADELAVEHLEIIAENANELSKKVNSAGLILINEYSSSLASDYMFGTNHVLPTLGFARSRGSLSVLDFLKLSTSAEASKEGLAKIIEHINVISNAEGLPNHAKAVGVRL